jgi:hypothetical protein
VVVADSRGKITEWRRLTRAPFERDWENGLPCRVLMEAGGSADPEAFREAQEPDL